MKPFIVLCCLLYGTGYGLYAEGFTEGLYDQSSFTYRKAQKYFDRGYQKGIATKIRSQNSVEIPASSKKDWLSEVEEVAIAQTDKCDRNNVFSVVDCGGN